jgi:ABC-type sugar transport system substrate-binding protein
MKPLVASLIAVVALALLAFAGLGSGVPSAAAQYAAKETICHKTGSTTNPEVTITVSGNAVEAHLAHGDELGAC